MQCREACSYWFWFHFGNITWWEYAVWECTFQVEPWDDSITRPIRGYEKWNLGTLCKVVTSLFDFILLSISAYPFILIKIILSCSLSNVGSLCVKGYLAARRYMNGIINTVLLMLDSGLPCFSRGDPIGNLRKRFHPEMSEREAANFMRNVCTDAYNKWTTAGYDLIQYLQQGIEK